ncbi:diguanylate cyclase/phosphodiesterase (GGDEF & EAL domains) with PAS/PAC sensor(s) [hydrothermal vent metagenome]|uniref:Diguanylate cyclase/phosphodiesterase (GGDEF & EAL domains) with PAS/PAC sensor(S) n=1 Tax=hydrothermal vent metagenome TaxID=652676 RepID=A0A3B0YHC1_9ZZZZ
MKGKNTGDFRTLPVRVTGIVFWGMVVIGLMTVLLMLNGREDQILQRQQAVVDRFMSSLYQEFLGHPVSGIQPLGELAERLKERSELIQGMRVQLAENDLWFGKTSRTAMLYTRPVWLPGGTGLPKAQASITLYLPSVELQVTENRKQLLLGLGGLFLFFGLILQRILDLVLSKPFRKMMNTAQVFSAGDEQIRFDETRNDEFGYLGRFINEALDYSSKQKQALHQAMTRAVESEQALQREKDQVEVTLHSIGDAVITTNRTGRIEYMNPIAEELLGCPLTEIRGTPLGKIMRLIDEDSGALLANPVDLCLDSGERIAEGNHKLLLRHDGEQIAIADSAAPIRSRQHELTGVVMVFHDVGQARKLARQLSFQARHDPLTGLFNRREFEAQLENLLETVQGSDLQHAMCYIDLDQFKVVNDVCGHSAGDELLRQLSALLQRQVREADVLARLGGDEFGVLLTHCSADQAARIAENIRSAVQGFRFLFGERSFEIGASIGVVAITTQNHSVSELMSAADIACYAAKDEGRNRVHLFEHSDAELKERHGEMNWVSEIHSAFDEQRFYLVYQPIVALSGEQTGQPAHYEFLLRMKDREGNEVLPMAFLPAAERYHLMARIDSWVVDAVMKLLSECNELPGQGGILINLSGASLADPGFVDSLERRLISANIPGGGICFEITESSAISNLRTIGDAIRRLRTQGCRFALDDFGSGLSAFGYLKGLEIDYIKIDGSIVRNIVSSNLDAAMVQAINDIGHAVGVHTIAEFVETVEVRDRLIALGVDFGQGHYIAAPRPVDELFGLRQPRLDLA